MPICKNIDVEHTEIQLLKSCYYEIEHQIQQKHR